MMSCKFIWLKTYGLKQQKNIYTQMQSILFLFCEYDILL